MVVFLWLVGWLPFVVRSILFDSDFVLVYLQVLMGVQHNLVGKFLPGDVNYYFASEVALVDIR